MRKWHRWISSAAMLLLTWVAVTGVLLAIDSMYPPAGRGGEAGGAAGPAAPAGAAAPANVPRDAVSDQPPAASVPLTQLTQWSEAALASVVPDDSSARSLDIQVSMLGSTPQATVSRDNSRITVDTRSGEMLSSRVATTAAQGGTAQSAPWYNNMETRLALHDLLQDLHRGTIIGVSGQVLDILTGLSFAFLSISGAVMYWQLYARRRKSGNANPFWK